MLLSAVVPVQAEASEPPERLFWSADEVETHAFEAETDAYSVAEIKERIPKELKDGNYTLRLIAESGDGDSELTRDVVLKRSFRILVTTDKPLRIEGVPESGTLVPGVENILYIVTAYADGRPAETTITIDGTSLTSSPAGIATPPLVPTGPEVALTVSARDGDGLKGTERLSLLAGLPSETFLLRTDHAVYRAGETARLRLLSAQPTGRIFLDVIQDRRTVLMTALDLEEGQDGFDLDLPLDLFGTLQIHAYRILDDGSIASDTKIIQVRRATDLKIQATFDRPTYQPGRPATLLWRPELITDVQGRATIQLDLADSITPWRIAMSAVSANRSEAIAALNRLDSFRQQAGNKTFWSSSGRGALYGRGYSLEIETTALAVIAYQKASYKPSAVGPAITWLIGKRDSRGTWHTTQATVLAMKALLANSGKTHARDADIDVTVTVNGVRTRLKITQDQGDVHQLITLTGMVRHGANVLSIESTGKGNLAYQRVATHYIPWPKVPVEKDRPIVIAQEYDTTELKINDILTCSVTIRFNRPGAANMTVATLGLPPGFQLIREDFEALRKDGTLERYTIRSQQVTLYFLKIENGKPVSFAYRLRAITPVRAQAPPAEVYPYYRPEWRHRTRPVPIDVR